MLVVVTPPREAAAQADPPTPRCLKRIVSRDIMFLQSDRTLARESCEEGTSKDVTYECAASGVKIHAAHDACIAHGALRLEGAAKCAAWRDRTAPDPSSTSACSPEECLPLPDGTVPEPGSVECIQELRQPYGLHAGQLVGNVPTIPLMSFALTFHNERSVRGCADLDVTATLVAILDPVAQSRLNALMRDGKSMHIEMRCLTAPVLEQVLAEDPAFNPGTKVASRRTTFPAGCELEEVKESVEPTTRCGGSPKKGLGVNNDAYESPEDLVRVLEALRLGWYHSWSIDGFAEGAPSAFIPTLAGRKHLGCPNTGACFSAPGIPADPKLMEAADEAYRNLADAVNTNAIPVPDLLLGFNEPDRVNQSNIPAEEAIALWPMVVARKKALYTAIRGRFLAETGLSSMRLGSPSVAADKSGLGNAAGWLSTFYEGEVLATTTTPGLIVKNTLNYIGVHWHKDRRDPNVFIRDMIALRERYGKPLVITELSPADWGERKGEYGLKPGLDRDGNYVCDTEHDRALAECSDQARLCDLRLLDKYTTCCTDAGLDVLSCVQTSCVKELGYGLKRYTDCCTAEGQNPAACLASTCANELPASLGEYATCCADGSYDLLECPGTACASHLATSTCQEAQAGCETKAEASDQECRCKPDQRYICDCWNRYPTNDCMDSASCEYTETSEDITLPELAGECSEIQAQCPQVCTLDPVTNEQKCEPGTCACRAKVEPACEPSIDAARTNHWTVEEMKAFMDVVIPWMNRTSWIHRYAWYSQIRADKPQNYTARLYDLEKLDTCGEMSQLDPTCFLTELGKHYASF